MSPLALDPEARFELVLETDLEKEWPPFVFRHLPCNDYRRLAEQADRLDQLQADPDSTPGQVLDELLGLVRLPLVDWKHMVDPATGTIPYDPSRLGDLLTVSEVMELLVRLRDEMALGVEAKKDSGSQLPSSTASSAPAAIPSSAEGSSANGPAPATSSNAPPAAGEAEAAPSAATANGS